MPPRKRPPQDRLRRAAAGRIRRASPFRRWATPRKDVFVSYARRDVDEDSVEIHESIPRRIREGLTNSRAMLVYYSRTYPTRIARRRELSQRTGSVDGHVLVVNPERDEAHIALVGLRDLRYQGLRNEAGASATGRERRRTDGRPARSAGPRTTGMATTPAFPAGMEPVRLRGFGHPVPPRPAAGGRMGRIPGGRMKGRLASSGVGMSPLPQKHRQPGWGSRPYSRSSGGRTGRCSGVQVKSTSCSV